MSEFDQNNYTTGGEPGPAPKEPIAHEPGRAPTAGNVYGEDRAARERSFRPTGAETGPAAHRNPYYPRDDRQAYPGTPHPPQYSGNHYPPHQGGYYPPAYRPNPQQGHAYPPHNSWQPQQPVPQEQYEWKFEDYEKLEKNSNGQNRKKSRGFVVFTVAILCMLAVGLVTLAGYSFLSSAADENSDEATSSQATNSDAGTELSIADRPQNAKEVPEGDLDIPLVAEAVLPSVVGVIKYDNDQYFEISGYGSGIVMTEDGYIITNAHVVAGGTGFKVQFTSGDAYDAELIGYDTMTDLAVLKIEASGLTPAEFGDSTSLRVGETVVAIGNPAGMELASSVTRGIISAVNREVRTTNYNMTFIQTDAAINPGNSGGALANTFGQVIGINSSKIVAAGYEGIGFAIPISSAKPIIDDIIANGRVTGRVMLGITCRPVDEVDARNYGIQMGLMIESIDPSSDLNSSGIMRGDIITHIGDERVYDLSSVRTILDQHKPGDSVSLTIYRKIGTTKEQTLQVETRLLESQ